MKANFYDFADDFFKLESKTSGEDWADIALEDGICTWCDRFGACLYMLASGQLEDYAIIPRSFPYEFVKTGYCDPGKDDIYGVFKYKDIYYKCFFRCYSHGDIDVAGIVGSLHIVVPKEKTIVVYE